MPSRYFEKFQNIVFANNVVVNLTERAVMLNKVTNNPYLFYPMDITNHTRPDQIADSYYNDQYMSWIIYLSNNIIDPYYQWYNDETVIEEAMKLKYNAEDVNVLKQKVIFYRNNWYEQEEVSVSFFNALPAQQRRYWEPVYNGAARPIGYERVKQDWIINTNQLVTYIVDAPATPYVKNEIVDIVYNNVDNNKGKAQVVVSNTYSNGAHFVSVQHTFGYTTEDLELTSYIYGRESKANTVMKEYVSFTDPITNDVSRSCRNIILEEQSAYWSPVYIYDFEMEKNENYKSIKVLNASYAPQLSSELKQLLG